jgi:hypothetical protein
MTADAPLHRYDAAWWRSRARRAGPLIALLAAAIVVAVIVTPEPDSGLPLDPVSTRPDGTLALMELLRGVGRDATAVAPDEPGAAPVVLLLRDQLTEDERRALEGRVEQGARLVVTDPRSPLAPQVIGAGLPFGLAPELERACRLPALRDVASVRPDDSARYELPARAQGCFGDREQGFWMVVQSRGRGHVVALGDAGFLTNTGLRHADNAVLAVQLLTPEGTDRVEVVRPVLRAESGGLLDLVSDGVRAAFWQLVIGFLVVAAWRARRLGAPLIERAPVRLASSDLTAAVGVLLGRNEGRAATLERLAEDTRRRLARRLGLTDTVDVGLLTEQLAARTSLDADEVTRVLQPAPPADDEAMLDATTALADLEQAVHTALTPMLEESNVR